jgi:long-subunit acyl-CoA synthetase (AMP-forming)
MERFLPGRFQRCITGGKPPVGLPVHALGLGRDGDVERIQLAKTLAKLVPLAIGSRLRVAVGGGASLAPAGDRFLCGLSVPVVEGCGLTEPALVVTPRTIERPPPRLRRRALDT